MGHTAITCYLAQLGLSSFIVGFTEPHSSLRLAALPVVTALCWQAILATPLDLPTSNAPAFVGGAFGYLLQYCEIALFRRASFKDGHQWPNDTLWNGVCFGIRTTCSLRAVGAKWQAKNTPAITTTSRAGSLARSAVICITTYLFFDLIAFNLPTDNPIKFAFPKEYFFTRLSDIDKGEFVERAVTSLSTYLGMYCLLSFCGEFLNF